MLHNRHSIAANAKTHRHTNMPEHALEATRHPSSAPAKVEPRDTLAHFVARQEHLWLGLMLLALHAATAWGIGSAWASAFLLAHFGLFLMWQPLWKGDDQIQASHAVLAVLNGALLAAVGSWWLIAL